MHDSNFKLFLGLLLCVCFCFSVLRYSQHISKILFVAYLCCYGFLQVISDIIVRKLVTSLMNLQVLAMCYCFGDISMSSFKFPMQNLRKLRLERVTPWMTNDDLVILSQNCRNLVELSLLGCPLLNSG